MFLKNTRKSIFSWLQRGFDNYHSMNEPVKCNTATPRFQHSTNDLNDRNAITFKIIKGVGGIAVEYNHYNHKTDEGTTVLHIVPEDKDLASEISHIITMQSLKG